LRDAGQSLVVPGWLTGRPTIRFAAGILARGGLGPNIMSNGKWRIIFQDLDTDGDGGVIHSRNPAKQLRYWDMQIRSKYLYRFVLDYGTEGYRRCAVMAAWMEDVKVAKKCSDRAE
jgi:hypothetical protein